MEKYFPSGSIRKIGLFVKWWLVWVYIPKGKQPIERALPIN
tara:strand:- start:225 stop:347 length:123 start_codon:yes stop_codon:yes gene_type:complete